MKDILDSEAANDIKVLELIACHFNEKMDFIIQHNEAIYLYFFF